MIHVSPNPSNMATLNDRMPIFPQGSINCCLIGNLQKNLSFCKLSLFHNLENVK